MYMYDTEMKNNKQLYEIKKELEEKTNTEIIKIDCIEQPLYVRHIIRILTKERQICLLHAVKDKKELKKLISKVSKNILEKQNS